MLLLHFENTDKVNIFPVNYSYKWFIYFFCNCVSILVLFNVIFVAKDQRTKARGLVPLSNQGYLSIEKIKSFILMATVEL